MGIPKGDMYTASKHAVLGVMRALHPIMEIKGIRVGCIHPFFAGKKKKKNDNFLLDLIFYIPKIPPLFLFLSSSSSLASL